MNQKEIKLNFNVDNKFTVREETTGLHISTYTFDGKIFFKIESSKPPFEESEYIKVFLDVIESHLGLILVGDRVEFCDNLHNKIIESMKLVCEKNETVSFQIKVYFREVYKKTIHEILSATVHPG